MAHNWIVQMCVKFSYNAQCKTNPNTVQALQASARHLISWLVYLHNDSSTPEQTELGTLITSLCGFQEVRISLNSWTVIELNHLRKYFFEFFRGGSDWVVACRLHIHRVQNDMGSNPHANTRDLSLTPSGLRLSTCCPDDCPSTWTPEEPPKVNQERVPKGSMTQEKRHRYKDLFASWQGGADYCPGPSRQPSSRARWNVVKKIINK